jgi:hypothetical protein
MPINSTNQVINTESSRKNESSTIYSTTTPFWLSLSASYQVLLVLSVCAVAFFRVSFVRVSNKIFWLELCSSFLLATAVTPPVADRLVERDPSGRC